MGVCKLVFDQSTRFGLASCILRESQVWSMLMVLMAVMLLPLSVVAENFVWAEATWLVALGSDAAK